MSEKIGEFLVRIGVMHPYQVGDVLRAQKAGDNRLFGEIASDRVWIHQRRGAQEVCGGDSNLGKRGLICQSKKAFANITLPAIFTI